MYTRFKLVSIIVVVSLSSSVFAGDRKISSDQISSQKAPAVQEVFGYKIDLPDPAIARKFAISYHHALLEMNYEQKFAVADLSEKEVKRLQSEGFTVSEAKQWNQKYRDFTHQKNALRQKNGKSTMPGIEGFECYATVEETFSAGEQLATQYDNLAEWVDIGDSWKKANGLGGYDLMVLKISNQEITADKPTLFIHSSMHAREYAPAALTLDFATEMLSNYQTNPDYRWIIDHHEIHILFHMNPDGRKIAETQISQRKNTNQNYCPSGSASGRIGVDLNRNFSFYWNAVAGGSSGNECDQTYRGPSPESEPETQAVSNYIRSLFPDVRGELQNDASPIDTPGLHLDIHSYSRLVLWPYGHTESPSPNDDGFVALGNKIAWYNNYMPQQSVGLYPTDGTSDDVSYGELGIAALTFELGNAFFEECAAYESTIRPDNLKALVYAAKVAAAPFLLSHGPEISQLLVNDSVVPVTLTAGSSLRLAATATASQTQLTQLGETISKLEYSIDSPIWDESTNTVELTDTDGSLSSSVETASVLIDTSALTIGEHIIYVRAYNQDDQVGVPTAALVSISDNNSPTADFLVNCVNLRCTFDATSSSDSDGTIESYQWSLDDNVTAVGETISYNYQTPGEKEVTLILLDNSNNRSSKQRTFTISSPPPEPQSSSGGGSFPPFYILGLLSLIGLIRSSSVRR
jgi:hypothetical protein